MSEPSVTGAPCNNVWPNLACTLFYRAFQRRLKLGMWYQGPREGAGVNEGCLQGHLPRGIKSGHGPRLIVNVPLGWCWLWLIHTSPRSQLPEDKVWSLQPPKSQPCFPKAKCAVTCLLRIQLTHRSLRWPLVPCKDTATLAHSYLPLTMASASTLCCRDIEV